jgi:glycosyltransferase involved in cell wall biosynthesis
VRIGWATPFNVRSAIGRFSLIVCEELQARGHEVEVIRIESGPELELESLATGVRVIGAEECDSSSYELLIVNFGNHAPYHAQALRLLAERAPLAIFHDAEMRDFEWGMLHRHGLKIPRALGVEQESVPAPGTDLLAPAAVPLLGTLASMCCGAVIHGPHYEGTVSAYCPGPVGVVPLCYPDTSVRRSARELSAGRRVTIFGVINDNKQPRRVLQAIAALKRSVGPIDLHLAGAVEDRYREALVAEAANLGVGAPTFHGYLSDEDLQDVLEDSHAICCLRYPVTEGGSASLATALYHGRPLLISDIASYSMIPDELAHKVSYGEKVEDVAQALRSIFQQQEEAEDRAAKARLWAEDRFSAASYVDSLEPVLRSARSYATLTAVARNLVPAISTPANDPMPVAVSAFAEVLDWMQTSQK